MMRRPIALIILTLMIIFSGTQKTMAIEEASYDLVKTEGSFELRDYAPHILAETFLRGDFEETGSKAFRKLFGYISGDNRSQKKIAMTAPVSQQQSEKITMTAPVSQQKSGDQWVVSFMMPSSYSLETLPIPDDPQIRLPQVAARRLAAICYSGFWSEKNYQKNKLRLDSWIEKEGLTVIGEAIWARYIARLSRGFYAGMKFLSPS
jgi:hypothetical protein